MTDNDSTTPPPAEQSVPYHWMIKHGMYNTPEHHAWGHMKDRCLNPRSQRYDRYGARGIKVCDRWRDSFEAFYADMGPRPGPEYSLDRIDNDGDYCPENCHWATHAEQNRNKSINIYIEHAGLKLTRAEWARRTGIGEKTLEFRINSGWTTKDALETPPESRRWGRKPGVRRQCLPLPEGITKYRGVTRGTSAWVACISVNGRPTNIGSFDDPIRAAIAYDEAARKHRGSKAKTNFGEREAAEILEAIKESEDFYGDP